MFAYYYDFLYLLIKTGENQGLSDISPSTTADPCTMM